MARQFRDRLALTYGFWSVVLIGVTGVMAVKFGWIPLEERPEGQAFVASSGRKLDQRKPALPPEFAAEPTEVAVAPEGDPFAGSMPTDDADPEKFADPDWIAQQQIEPAVSEPLPRAIDPPPPQEVASAAPSDWTDDSSESVPAASEPVSSTSLEDAIPGAALADIGAGSRRSGSGNIDYSAVPTEPPPGDLLSDEDNIVIRPKRPERPPQRARAAGRSFASGARMLDGEPPRRGLTAASHNEAFPVASGGPATRRFSRDDGFATSAGAGGIVPAGNEAPPSGNRAVAMADPRIAEIDRLLESGDRLGAHKEMSRLYWKHPELVPELQPKVDDNAKLIYFSPQPHYMEPYVIEPGDQLSRIARKYSVSWQYLAKLNNTDPKKIRPGQRLKVIKGPFAAIADLSDFELVVHCHGYYVKRYPIGIGKNESTPTGKFTVKTKLVNPTYYGPNGLVLDADDPSNPLGERWIDLGDSYGIHGTIDPDSIGKAESRGCIRLKNADVEEVFDLLTEGSEVIIRN